jgi:hypothetical protein
MDAGYMPRKGVRRGPLPGRAVSSMDPAMSSAELETVTTLCEGCGLVVFPRETCQWCSGGAGRWLRYWLPGIETR